MSIAERLLAIQWLWNGSFKALICWTDKRRDCQQLLVGIYYEAQTANISTDILLPATYEVKTSISFEEKSRIILNMKPQTETNQNVERREEKIDWLFPCREKLWGKFLINGVCMLHTSLWIASSFHFYECAAKDSRLKRKEIGSQILAQIDRKIYSREWNGKLAHFLCGESFEGKKSEGGKKLDDKKKVRRVGSSRHGVSLRFHYEFLYPTRPPSTRNLLKRKTVSLSCFSFRLSSRGKIIKHNERVFALAIDSVSNRFSLEADAIFRSLNKREKREREEKRNKQKNKNHQVN